MQDVPSVPVIASEQALGDLLMARKPDPLLAELAKAAEDSSRSKLTAWMRSNYEDFADLLRRRGAAWEKWARLFIEKGLMPKPADYDEPGKVGDAARARAGETAKRAWNRTRQRMEASSGTQRGRKSNRRDAAAPGAPAQSDAPGTEGGDDLLFAKPKNWKG